MKIIINERDFRKELHRILVKMRLTLCFLFVISSCWAATESYVQNAEVTITKSSMTLKELIDVIESKTEIIFIYNDADIDVNRKVQTIRGRHAVLDVLDREFLGTTIKYKVFDRQIALYKAEAEAPTEVNLTAMIEQQQRGKPVSGTVVDTNGEPVAGANIAEKGTANGISTDAEGRFTLNVQPDATLLVSYIGFASQEMKIIDSKPLIIIMNEDAQALEEVVVVGYGVQKKVNLSGAVNAISSQALKNRPVTNANVALQGLSPNLNIIRSSGMTTQAPDINIRGFTSINGGSAFILVDNVPVSPEELSRMNPSDIESVSVLKDASSAAIYGARAAFGVLLITTKTAKNEDIQVDADYTFSLRTFDNLPEISLDISELMRIQNIMSRNPERFNDAAIEYGRRRMQDLSLPEILGPGREKGGINDRLIRDGEWEYYGVYDWLDMVYKDHSPSRTANVRIAKKGDKLAYSVSGGLFDQDGMLNYGNDSYKRYNFRGNATYDLSDRWKLGTNISFNHSDYNMNSGLDANDAWNFYYFSGSYVTHGIYNPDGTYTECGIRIGELLDGGRAITVTDATQLSFNTKFDILKNVWSINADANIRITNQDKDVTSFPVAGQIKPDGTNAPERNLVSLTRNGSRYTVYNLYTNFDKIFAGKHFVSAVLGFNQEHTYYNDFTATQYKLITESLPTIQLALEDLQRSQDIGELSLQGIFGRFNYIYDNKYIIEADGRRDGSSRFPKGSKWGFFPSFSAAYVLSHEGFFENIRKNLNISNLKLRASYGSLGNQDVKGYYPYVASMGFLNQINPVINGSRPMAITAPESNAGAITWETVSTLNAGIDIAFCNNKLDFSFDKYTRYTKNMLTKSKTLPGVYGISEPLSNAADLETKGWELSIGYRDEINVGGSPLSYSLRFFLADSRAWITRYDNPNKNLSDYYEGQEVGEIWGYTTLGYFASDEEATSWADQSAVGNSANSYKFYAGDLKFADINNDNKINNGNNSAIDPGDMKIIGNDRERFPYSVDVDAAWKGIDLRVFFQGTGHRDAYPTASTNGTLFWGIYRTPWISPSVKNLDNWTPENTDAYFPRLKPSIGANGELAKVQTKYLQNASYLRLKNLTLGYTLPFSVLKTWHVNNLRVFFTGENLFTYHHIEVPGNDPERFDTIFYPFQKTYSLGLSINFK
jgi:TonB-linked SusC/RagA family outer membrane protein